MTYEVPNPISSWGGLKVTIQRVKKGLATDRERWIYIRRSYTKEKNYTFFGEEYDKLSIDERVQALSVTEEDGIHLLTVPVLKELEFGGQKYVVFLGTYEIQVTLASYSMLFGKLPTHSHTKFWVACVESGRLDGSLMTTYPVSDTHNFCFGTRTKFLEELANAGEFYTFFNLVLDSLWHINPTSVKLILEQFKKMDKSFNIEPGASHAIS